MKIPSSKDALANNKFDSTKKVFGSLVISTKSIHEPLSNNQTIEKEKNKTMRSSQGSQLNGMETIIRGRLGSGNKDTVYNIEKLGEIKLAKEHRDASRLMKKISDFPKEIKFCRCCFLPRELKNVIEPYRFCDKSEQYSQCGIGAFLYFLYFKFSIISLFIVALMTTSVSMYTNEHYTRGLNRICNNIYETHQNSLPLEIKICAKFVTHASGSYYYNNNTDWALRFNSDNIKVYRKISKITTGTANADRVVIDYNFVNFICLFTLLVVNVYYCFLIRTYVKSADYSNISPSDYTLMITNLQSYPEKFKEDIKNLKNTKEYKNVPEYKIFIKLLEEKVLYAGNEEKISEIDSINLAYKMDDYMETENNLKEAKHKLFQVKYNPYQIKKNKELGYEGHNIRYFKSPLFKFGCLCCEDEGEEVKNIKRDRDVLMDKEVKILENIKNLNTEMFSGVLFVTFKTIKNAEDFYGEFPHSFLHLTWRFIKSLPYYLFFCCIDKKKVENFHNRNKMKVFMAPEPDDIIWENLEYTTLQRFIRSLVVYLITFLLLLVAFGLVSLLTYLQERSNDHNWSGNTAIKFIVSIAITGVISGINELFEMILESITKYEKQRIMSEYYLSYSVKLSFFTFLTSGLVPLASNYVRNGWRNNELLVNNMLMLFLVNSFVTPTIWAININYVIKTIRIWLIERKPEPDKEHNMSQKELNELYELPDMKIANKYSYIAKTLLMTFFYVNIFPIGVLISLVGFLYGYFVEKYNMTRLYKRPEMLNESICCFYMEHFTIFLFVFAIGNYLFIFDLTDSNDWPLGIIISYGILTIIPYTRFFKCNVIGINESEINRKTIDEARPNFFNDYERQNPMTKRIGIQNYLERLAKENLISKEELELFIKNLDSINVIELYDTNRKNYSLMQSQRALANSKVSKNKGWQSFIMGTIKNSNQNVKDSLSKSLGAFLCKSVLGNKTNNDDIKYPLKSNDTIESVDELSVPEEGEINRTSPYRTGTFNDAFCGTEPKLTEKSEKTTENKGDKDSIEIAVDNKKAKGILISPENKENTEEKPKKKLNFLDLLKKGKKNKDNEQDNNLKYTCENNYIKVEEEDNGSKEKIMTTNKTPLKRKETENIMGNIFSQYKNPILMNMGLFLNPNQKFDDYDDI